jgi:hypothetical protein
MTPRRAQNQQQTLRDRLGLILVHTATGRYRGAKRPLRSGPMRRDKREFFPKGM